MTQFIYKEMPMQLNRDLISQINEQGKSGWQFKTQAQNISPIKDIRTGMPKQTIVIIYEKAVEVPELKNKN